MVVLLLLLLLLLVVDLEVETSRIPLLWTHTSSNRHLTGSICAAPVHKNVFLRMPPHPVACGCKSYAISSVDVLSLASCTCSCDTK